MKPTILLIAIGLLAGSTAVYAMDPAVPMSITIFPVDTVIAAGSTLQFYTEIRDDKGDRIDSQVEWIMTGDAVGPLSSRGFLVADWTGRILIIASSGSVTDTAQVIIHGQDSAALSMSNGRLRK